MPARTATSLVWVAGHRAAVTLLAAPDRGAPTILALHGFTGSGEDFLPLREALGADCAHWVLPDFMGHGASASPAVLDPYCLPAVLRLIDAARLLAPDPRRVVLVGYSMGGRLALHYLRWAAPLPCLLIGASPGLQDEAERRRRRHEDRRWAAQLLAPGDTSARMEAFCAAWEAQPLIAPQTLLPQPLRTLLAARRRRNDPVGLAHALLACGAGTLPPLWRHLPELPPCTWLHGAGDAKFAAIAAEAATRNSGFAPVAVPGAGHAPHLEAPHAVATVLRGLLSR